MKKLLSTLALLCAVMGSPSVVIGADIDANLEVVAGNNAYVPGIQKFLSEVPENLLVVNLTVKNNWDNGTDSYRIYPNTWLADKKDSIVINFKRLSSTQDQTAFLNGEHADLETLQVSLGAFLPINTYKESFLLTYQNIFGAAQKQDARYLPYALTINGYIVDTQRFSVTYPFFEENKFVDDTVRYPEVLVFKMTEQKKLYISKNETVDFSNA